MEGQQLQWDDTEDPLQAVDTVGHIDGAAGVLYGLVIIFITDHDGPTLENKFKWGNICEDFLNLQRSHT